MFRLDGWLDPEGGACLQSALSSLIGPGSGDDFRPATQRRADAPVELARQRLDRGGLPEVAGQRPHLSLISKPGMLLGDLEWAGVVPGETVRRLACDAALTVIQEGVDGDPVGVGRTSRTVPPGTRRALVLRDRGCRFAGCDRPPDWTDGHHIEHWSDGGAHTLQNLVLLCRRHHRRVHEEGWRLAWSHDRELVALPT